MQSGNGPRRADRTGRGRLIALAICLCLVVEADAQHYVQHVQHHAHHVATYCPPHQQTLVLPVATFFPVYGAPYYGHGGGAQRQAAPEDAERIAKIETSVTQLTANVTQLTAAVTQLAEAMKKKE